MLSNDRGMINTWQAIYTVFSYGQLVGWLRDDSNTMINVSHSGDQAGPAHLTVSHMIFPPS
jgi:hypothetical protein